MIRLRRADAADADALGEVHVAAWRETYAGLMPAAVLAGLDARQRAALWRRGMAGSTEVHIAEQAADIVAFGASGPQRDASLPFAREIIALYVLRRAQRQGIGRRLMAAMAREMLGAGHASVLLWVLDTNQPARCFYSALGGREIARRTQQRDGFAAVGVAYGWDDLATLL